MVKLITLAAIVLTLRAGQNENKALGTPRIAPVTFEVPARRLTEWNDDEAVYLVNKKFARLPTDKDIFPAFNVPEHLPLVTSPVLSQNEAEQVAQFNAEVERRQNEQAAARILAEQNQKKANDESNADAERIAAEQEAERAAKEAEAKAATEAAKSKQAEAKANTKKTAQKIVEDGSNGTIKPSEAPKLKADADKGETTGEDLV